MSEQPIIADPVDEEFRKQNNHHGFLAGLYSSVSGAALIAALGTITKAILPATGGAAATAMGATTAAGGAAIASTTATGIGLLFGATALTIAGLLVVGVAFAYWAQREYTEQSCIRDRHSAQQIAKEKALSRAQEMAVAKTTSITTESVTTPGFEQNARADGKAWTATVNASGPSVELGGSLSAALKPASVTNGAAWTEAVTAPTPELPLQKAI